MLWSWIAIFYAIQKFICFLYFSLQKPTDGFGSPMHISRSPLSTSLRTCSPASDSGASSLSPVVSNTVFMFDTTVENQILGDHNHQPPSEGSSQDTVGGTPTSSPSKSCHIAALPPLHHVDNHSKMRKSAGRWYNVPEDLTFALWTYYCDNLSCYNFKRRLIIV